MEGLFATILLGLLVWGVVAVIKGFVRSVQKAESARRALIEDSIKRHLPALRRKRRQLVLVDEYGTERDAGWKKEVVHFLRAAAKEAGVNDYSHFGFLQHPDRQWTEVRIDELLSQTQGAPEAEPQNVRAMTPLDFEEHCADLLRRAGWSARRTQASGDQGVDVIAEKGGHKVALQCKQYAQPVGNYAVQEAEAGRLFHGASVAAVVSNAAFTVSAKRLAASTGTLLLHYDELRHLESMISKAVNASPDAPHTKAVNASPDAPHTLSYYYYANADERFIGPVSFVELQRLRGVGTIHDLTWVCEEGETKWKPLQSVLGIPGR